MDAWKSVLLATLIVVAAGCARVAGYGAASKAAVKSFHQQLNDARFDEIISGATAGFRIAAPPAELR